MSSTDTSREPSTFVTSETRREYLLRTGRSRPRVLQGVYPFAGRGIFETVPLLVTHRGKFFSRARLLDMVWGVEFEGTERTVDIHIRRLRAKLPPHFAALLETRRGIGYGFRTPD